MLVFRLGLRLVLGFRSWLGIRLTLVLELGIRLVLGLLGFRLGLSLG